MMRLVAVFVLLAVTPVIAADQRPKSPDELECKTGPVTKTYGGTPWLIYACNDGHSLSLVSAPGSKAMPFVFMFHWEAGQYQLSGVGTGNKAATDAAFREIGAFTGRDILALLSEAQRAHNHP